MGAPWRRILHNQVCYWSEDVDACNFTQYASRGVWRYPWSSPSSCWSTGHFLTTTAVQPAVEDPYFLPDSPIVPDNMADAVDACRLFALPPAYRSSWDRQLPPVLLRRVAAHPGVQCVKIFWPKWTGSPGGWPRVGGVGWVLSVSYKGVEFSSNPQLFKVSSITTYWKQFPFILWIEGCLVGDIFYHKRSNKC